MSFESVILKFKPLTNGWFGSLADLNTDITPTAAIGGKADIPACPTLREISQLALMSALIVSRRSAHWNFEKIDFR
jgi:hypothetical protein